MKTREYLLALGGICLLANGAHAQRKQIVLKTPENTTFSQAVMVEGKLTGKPNKGYFTLATDRGTIRVDARNVGVRNGSKFVPQSSMKAGTNVRLTGTWTGTTGFNAGEIIVLNGSNDTRMASARGTGNTRLVNLATTTRRPAAVSRWNDAAVDARTVDITMPLRRNTGEPRMVFNPNIHRSAAAYPKPALFNPITSSGYAAIQEQERVQYFGSPWNTGGSVFNGGGFSPSPFPTVPAGEFVFDSTTGNTVFVPSTGFDLGVNPGFNSSPFVGFNGTFVPGFAPQGFGSGFNLGVNPGFNSQPFVGYNGTFIPGFAPPGYGPGFNLGVNPGFNTGFNPVAPGLTPSILSGTTGR